MRQSLADRFWAKVKKGLPEDCWEWQAGTNSKGYGWMYTEHGSRPSHRVSALLHDLIESIHSTLHVLHTCDNPKCCNPKHLFTGTNADNVADRTAKGRTKTPLQYGALNSMSKLTIEQVRQIRGLYFASRFSQSQLAKKYGIRQSHVSRLVNGLRWGEML